MQMMAKRFSPALLGLLLSGALAVPALAAPELQLTETEHDWGDINQGVVATYTIHVKNAGDAPLEILDAKSSCECTVPTVQTKIVSPGATGDILVTFDSKRFTGKESKEITIYSNDPAHGESSFHFSANVIPPLSITPEVVDLGEVPRAGGITRTLTVNATDKKPFKITGVKTGLPFIQSQVSGGAAAAGATTYTISLTTSAGAPPGPFTDFLVVTTTHGSGDTLQAVVKGEVETVFQSDPAGLAIRFGSRVPKNNDKLGELKLSYVGKGTAHFLSAVPSSPAIRAELKPENGGTTATLTVYLTDKAASASGRFTGSVMVKTDNADQPEVSVKVLGYIRS